MSDSSPIRVISDVPNDKLEDLVKDLQYEVGKDNIRVTLQSDSMWRIEYSKPQLVSPLSGTFSGSNSGPPWR
jgi:hypothetical protein